MHTLPISNPARKKTDVCMKDYRVFVASESVVTTSYIFIQVKK